MKYDIKEITRQLNELSQKVGGAEMPREMLLRNLLFIFGHKPMAEKMISKMEKLNILSSRKEGVRKYYKFPDKPIGKELVTTLLTHKKKNAVEEAVALLKKNGYMVMKPTRFSVSKAKELLGADIAKCYDYEQC